MVTGPCVKLQQPLCSLINRVQRLFFLNEAQNLSSFLIADLGVAKYPSYDVTRSRSVFTCRQDLLAYEQALQHAAELDNALEVSKTQQSAMEACCPAISSKDDKCNEQANACNWSLCQANPSHASGSCCGCCDTEMRRPSFYAHGVSGPCT